MPVLSSHTTVDSNSCESPAPGLEKMYFSDIAKNFELMHKSLGQIEKKLDDWKKVYKSLNGDNKLSDGSRLEQIGLSEAVLPVAQDCSDGANNYGLGNSAPYDTDAKADGQESADVTALPSSPIEKLAVSDNVSAGGLGVQESTKTDDLDVDKTSNDNISPTSGNQSDVFPTLEATTAVPVNVKSD